MAERRYPGSRRCYGRRPHTNGWVEWIPVRRRVPSPRRGDRRARRPPRTPPPHVLGRPRRRDDSLQWRSGRRRPRGTGQIAARLLADVSSLLVGVKVVRPRSLPRSTLYPDSAAQIDSTEEGYRTGDRGNWPWNWCLGEAPLPPAGDHGDAVAISSRVTARLRAAPAEYGSPIVPTWRSFRPERVSAWLTMDPRGARRNNPAAWADVPPPSSGEGASTCPDRVRLRRTGQSALAGFRLRAQTATHRSSHPAGP